MRYTASILAALLAVGCTTPVENKTTEARLRNSPPTTCTDDQMKACPAVAFEACADGSEPVIDYSSDCCAHFSCQKKCQSAAVCKDTPAPACPAGTKLWIGTAIEDCCPAYRCEPDGSVTCGGKEIVCTLALPYCGEGVEPVVVGQSADCCPIYQCPCMKNDDPTRPVDANCGCTYPVCLPGYELVCKGDNICGYPCDCVQAHGMCASDADCSADARCDLTACLLPPVYDDTNAGPAECPREKCGEVPPTRPPEVCADGSMAGFTGRCLVDSANGCSWEFTRCAVVTECPAEKCGPQLGMPTRLCEDGKTTAGPTGRCILSEAEGRCVWEISECPLPDCDPADCGPQLGMPNERCEDGSIGGPTGRCLRNADGVCGWEVVKCPPTTGCFGVCVPNVQAGCKADMECPTGQRCELSCMGWGCTPGSDPTQPSTCACDLNDPSCYCDPATGICKGQTCEGRCVPVGPVCDKVDPVACPAIAPVCDNGAQPVAVGNDPVTCCPIFECPRCASDNTVVCAMPECACVISKEIDPNNCCPIYKCGEMDPATGKCL